MQMENAENDVGAEVPKNDVKLRPEELATPFVKEGAFQIHTEHFEGPLDLLLNLVEKRKLFISDISLSKVADEFISHVRGFEAYPMGDVANFLLVASTLVLIKSKSILPELNLTKEEESDIDDLKIRLAMLELFKSVAETMESHFGKVKLYQRSGRMKLSDIGPTFVPDEQMSAAAMLESAASVLNALPKKQTLPKATIRKVVSIEEMMEQLLMRVTGALKTSFSRFASYKRGQSISKEERVNVIVSFIAMLELVKQGALSAIQEVQEGDWGDIEIEPIELETPSYV